MINFSSVILKTDVTALKITQKYIVAAIGDTLNIFEATTQELQQKLKIFDGENIHGISSTQDGRFLIYGGPHLGLISDDFKILNSTKCRDWVLAIKHLKSDKIATISMHNTLEIFSNKLELLNRIFCKEKCILYSAFILEKSEDIIILSGTVFSEILIWKSSSGGVLCKLQGHKGVIFSIDYDETQNFIASSSDDRSTILWQVNNSKFDDIVLKFKVYGHSSRIFRSKITENYLITAGEDSVINIWNLKGELVRKFEINQGSPIWTLDCTKNYIACGGANGGITIFPIYVKIDEKKLLLGASHGKLKHVGILASNNLVGITESGYLFYHNGNNGCTSQVRKHDDLKNYCLLEIARCRRLIALAGFNSQVYIYRECGANDLKLTAKTIVSKDKSRILAFHWLTCSLFMTCQHGGVLTLFWLHNDKISIIRHFRLPGYKENNSTSACLSANGILIVGDRRGNVHVFKVTAKLDDAYFTLKKATNHLGVTKILNYNDKILVLSRNGIVKSFKIVANDLLLTSCDKLTFNWLADMSDDIIAGFSGNNFVLFDYKSRRLLFERNCGGGHRSWDFVKTSHEFVICYIKDGDIIITRFDLNQVIPRDLVQGYHYNEINSLVCFKTGNDRGLCVISGGEDTNLRVSLINNDKFIDISNLKSHLSSIRSICCYQVSSDFYIVISAGGRGQIVVWTLEQSETCDIVFKSSYYAYDSNESESRIMDIKVTKIDNEIILYTACSDGNLKLYKISEKFEIIPYKSTLYQRKCITKILLYSDSHLLICFLTNGTAIFYDISAMMAIPLDDVIQIHQSGINACHGLNLKSENYVMLTGGDDNAIALNLIRRESSHLDRAASFLDVGTHCAQISGVYLGDKLFYTCGLDQRLVLHSWELKSNCEEFNCLKLRVYKTTIADIHGMEIVEDRVVLYGRGVEVLKVWTNND